MTSPADPSAHVLIVDDEQALLRTLQKGLKKHGYASYAAADIASALAIVDKERVDLVLTDLQLDNESGLDLAERLRGSRPDIPVVLMTAYGSLRSAVDALRAGIQDFIQKPIDLAEIGLRIERALEHRALIDEVRRLRETAAEPTRDTELLGESKAMVRLRELVSRLAIVDTPVLITGESGTGKELVARALHRESERAEGPFVPVNCAALPDSVAESELFGHEKGAFTDAKSARDGLFVQADGGTLFLDEVGELSLETQAKLLRALQEHKVRAVGASKEVGFDARVLAATNRDLEAEVEAGRFREDLFFRLCVVDINTPPLRARGADVLALAQVFLRRASQKMGREVKGFVPEAARALSDYDWPGNVRELENAIVRAVALARNDHVAVDDLPERIGAYRRPLADDGLPVSSDPSQMLPLVEVENRYIQRVLKACGGNKSQAARVLGFDRRTLYRRLEQLEGGDGTPDPDEENAQASA